MAHSLAEMKVAKRALRAAVCLVVQMGISLVDSKEKKLIESKVLN